MDNIVEKLGELLKNAPIPQIVLLFGGLFVIVSITSHSIYIFESFLTFIYGVFSTYVRIVRKDGKLNYWPYFLIQASIFIICAGVILIRLWL